MKLTQLLQEETLSLPEKQMFVRQIEPSLDIKRLSCVPLVGAERSILKHTAFAGDVSAVLYYRGSKRPLPQEAAIMCLQEEEGGEQWRVMQVKGAKSSVSYRVAKGFEITRYFAAFARSLVFDTRAEARRIILPICADLQNLEEVSADSSGRLHMLYKCFRTAVGMVFSREENAYVFDLKKDRACVSTV